MARSAVSLWPARAAKSFPGLPRTAQDGTIGVQGRRHLPERTARAMRGSHGRKPRRGGGLAFSRCQRAPQRRFWACTCDRSRRGFARLVARKHRPRVGARHGISQRLRSSSEQAGGPRRREPPVRVRVCCWRCDAASPCPGRTAPQAKARCVGQSGPGFGRGRAAQFVGGVNGDWLYRYVAREWSDA